MTFEHRTGDIFAQPDLEGIGQGVNCKGKMGSGIAVTFRNRFKLMHDEYVALCAVEKLQLGMVHEWYEEHEDLWIYNIASQYHTGRDARMDALLTGVETMLTHADRQGLKTVGLPQIGCGIGGLKWSKVAPQLEAMAEDFNTHLVLVTYEG